MLRFSPLKSVKNFQLREVRSWRGGREELRLAELSRWIVASEWIIWLYTGYLYPDGHVSFPIRTRANKIIRWANWQRASWLCVTDFAAKTSLGIVLENFLQMRRRNLAKTSLGIVLEYFLQMRWGNLAKTSLGLVLEKFCRWDEEIWQRQV